MTLARFFDRVYAAAGKHLSVSRESLESLLDGKTVGIRVSSSPDVAQSWTAELLTNLVARLFPRIAFECDDGVSASLSTSAREIHPEIDVVEGSDATHWVNVGPIEDSRPCVVAVGSAGWNILVGPSLDASIRGPATPYAAAAAACLGMGALFQHIFIDATTSIDSLELSLLNYQRNDVTSRSVGVSELDIAVVGLVGLGAVANGALWTLLRHTGLRAKMLAIDAERIELSNLQRYVLTRDTDVDRVKSDLVVSSAIGTNIEIAPYAAPFETLDRDLLESVPTMLVSVDNVPTRRAVQATLPRLVVNGWTSDTGLGASWHMLAKQAGCLSCLYQPTGIAPSQTELAARALGIKAERAALLWVTDERLSLDDLKKIERHLGLRKNALHDWHKRRIQDIYSEVVCGMVPVSLPGLKRLEAVPLAHQSCLAGVFAAAELVKRLDSRLTGAAQSEAVVAWHDIRRSFPSRATQPLASVPGCICLDEDYISVYREKWLGGEAAPQVAR